MNRQVSVAAAWLFVFFGADACLARLDRPDVDSETIQANTSRQRKAASELVAARRAHLLRVGYKLRVGAVDLCGDAVAPLLGASIGCQTDVSLRGRPAEAAEIFGLVEEVKVLSVAPESPAARAGLRLGDLLIRVHGRAIRMTRDVLDGLRSYHPPGSSSEIPPVSLVVKRESETKEIALPVQMGCQHDMQLTMSRDFDTRALGWATLLVPMGLLSFVRDDQELAIVLAHQMAHHVLDESLLPEVQREPAADRLGLYMAARAGFDVSGASALLDRMVAYEPIKLEHETKVGSTPNLHAGAAERSLEVRKTVAEILEKIERGEELRP